MIITCEECDTSFNLEDSRLKPSGSKVRCSKCQRIFMVYPPVSAIEEEPHVKDKTITGASETNRYKLDLSLDMDAEGEEVAADNRESEFTDELDLSDLELELDMEKSTKDGDVDEFKELELELGELDQLEMLTSRAETVVKESFDDQKIDEPELDDLELSSSGFKKTGNDDTDEMADFKLEIKDLDELGILASENETAVSEAAEGQDDLDLGDFDMVLNEVQDDERGEIHKDAEADIILGEKADVELTGIDEILEMDRPIEIENEEELTFEDLDESDAVDRSRDSTRIDLFEVEEISREVASESLEPFSMGNDQKEAVTAKTAVSPSFSVGKGIRRAPVAKASEPVKKGISKWIAGIGIAVLFIGGAFAVLHYLGVAIPFITETTQSEDPKGNLNITLLNYTGAFLDNVHGGKLYVVRGQARNDYTEPRGIIQITGNLYSRGNLLIKKETVFCGNSLSDPDLTNLEFDAIRNRLNNRIGDNGSNIRLEPGKQLPFMIVFSDLPEELEEFTLNVEGSLKVQSQ